MPLQYDLAVVGAGPGGYVAAIRAAQLGMKTVLVDKNPFLGGTCLNIGCIPSKALLDSSERFHGVHEGMSDHGIEIGSVSLDVTAMMKRKTAVVNQLTVGVATLMKKNGVDVVTGTATVTAPGSLTVATDAGSEEISAGSILLATGSVPQELPFLPFDGRTIVSSNEALSFESVPAELLVVGAGAIGLELGSVWARLGSKVTIIEIMDTVLPGWDLQIGRLLPRYLKQIGIDVKTSTRVIRAEVIDGRVQLTAEDKKGESLQMTGDKVLVAVGRRPFLSDEFEGLGITIQNGRVVVNDRFETSIPGIYAIGDIISGPMLAHKAEEDGIACVEGLAGLPIHVDYSLVPNVVYTWPEAASVGQTEETLKEQKISYVKGSFPFRANGRALAAGEAEGFVKILADPDSSRILGAHIVGPSASALISELVAVMAIGGNAEDVGRIVHAHPTLPEAVKEAGLSVFGAAIHSA